MSEGEVRNEHAAARGLLLAQRQPLTISGYQKKFLKQSVVAVVGMSGGGSQVVPYLATFGVGEIIARHATGQNYAGA